MLIKKDNIMRQIADEKLDLYREKGYVRVEVTANEQVEQSANKKSGRKSASGNSKGK